MQALTCYTKHGADRCVFLPVFFPSFNSLLLRSATFLFRAAAEMSAKVRAPTYFQAEKTIEYGSKQTLAVTVESLHNLWLVQRENRRCCVNLS